MINAALPQWQLQRLPFTVELSRYDKQSIASKSSNNWRHFDAAF
jgi:hypothetical protein